MIIMIMILIPPGVLREAEALGQQCPADLNLNRSGRPGARSEKEKRAKGGERREGRGGASTNGVTANSMLFDRGTRLTSGRRDSIRRRHLGVSLENADVIEAGQNPLYTPPPLRGGGGGV